MKNIFKFGLVFYLTNLIVCLPYDRLNEVGTDNVADYYDDYGQDFDEEVNPIQVLDASNFNSEINKNNYLIMFYSDDDTQSKNLTPIFEKYYRRLQHNNEARVTLAYVDCGTDKILCGVENVTTLPTFRFYRHGTMRYVDFDQDEGLLIGLAYFTSYGLTV